MELPVTPSDSWWTWVLQFTPLKSSFILPLEKRDSVYHGAVGGQIDLFKTGNAVCRERPGQTEEGDWNGEEELGISPSLFSYPLRHFSFPSGGQPCTEMEVFSAASLLLSLFTGDLLTTQTSLAFLVLSWLCFLRVEILTHEV